MAASVVQTFPKRYQVSLNKDLFPDLMHVIHSTFDQRHRFPVDRFGHDFASPEVFDPVEALDELDELDRVLKVLEFREILPHLRSLGIRSIFD